MPEETPAVSESPTESVEATEQPADDTGEQESTEKKSRGGFQARIDKLTWEKNQREREAEYWRQRAMETAKPAEPPKPPEPPPTMPTLESVGYDEAKYQAALVEFARAEARRETEAILTRREQEAQQRAKEQSFRQREANVRAKYDDYESVAYYAPLSDTVVEMVKESEEGPELAYYLGKNPEIAKTISQLPERAAARELGRIEQKLAMQRETAAKPVAAPKPQVSEAPPPPPKIEAVEPDTRKSIYDDSMSVDEWMALRNKQVRKRN